MVAVLCAVIAGIAVARGAGGVAGGAVGVWIPAAVLSLAASFASQWTPLVVSGAALVGGLVLGAVARTIVAATAPRRLEAQALRAEEQAAAPAARPAASTAAGTSTGSLPALAG